MKLTRLFLLAATLTAGCATPNNDSFESRAEISYYDRNGDGMVDYERHHFPGAADADWELSDEDHNGRFEKKVLFGIGVFTSTVDIPVPSGVKISKR